MKNNILLCLALMLVPMTTKAVGQSGMYQWSVGLTGYVSPETGIAPTAYLWIPEGCRTVKAAVVAQQNMTEEMIFKSSVFQERMAELSVALIWVAPWFSQNWDPQTGCQQTFEEIMIGLAGQSGHKELEQVPVVPLGHSAQATFPWNFAAWNPERTLAIISFHGDAPRTNLCGYGTANVEWGRSRNIDGIPGLMIEGEYEWWEARVRPALAFQMMYPKACISFLCDTGSGHFECMPETAEYIALFIRKAMEQRLQADGSLRKVNPEDGWLACRFNPDLQPTDGDGARNDIFAIAQRPQAAPYTQYHGDRHDAFWYFDRQMAELTERRYAETRGKRTRTIEVGEPQWSADGTTLTIKVPTDVRLEVISGPLQLFTSDSSLFTFKVYPYEAGLDNPKRSFTAWLIAIHDGDKEYKRAVQPIEIKIPKQERRMTNDEAFSQCIVRPFELKDVRLLPSRFQSNMQRDSAWIASIPVNRLLHSFRNTAGLYSALEGGYDTGLKLGGWESLDCDLRGHITGHLLSAMAYLQMKENADSLVRGLAEVQRQYGTGYLSAFGEGLIDRNIAGKSVWAPFYTLHKILQGLIDQFTMCGNATALEVARGVGDWAYNKLKPLSEETRQKMIRNEFGGFNEAMYNLNGLVEGSKYLQVARFFYHNDKVDPLKQGNTDLGTNHANTFIPKLLGECRNYELCGDESSRMAAENLFWTLVNDHAFVTGEVSDKEHLFKPESQSHHLTGYDGENCCTYNLLKLADRLFTYQPDSRIADYYERALYNHILGQQDTLTSMVCYFTPLMTGGYRLYSTRDSSFWCCVGSGFESHAKYNSSNYFHSDKELYVNLFIPSEVNWNGTVVRQQTSFPESNKTVITASSEIALKIRYPYWATYMKVNGKRVKANNEGYVAIKTTKKAEIEFGMSLHEEATKDDPSRVALLYGPIVLGGRLSEVAHPFSDPKKHNDYYTFDYGIRPDVTLGDVKHLDGLHFETNGIHILPFYDLQHCRYVVYWNK